MSTVISEARLFEDRDEFEPEAGPEPVDVAEGADWNVVERAFLTRRSIRKFKRRQVPAHLIHRMLEVGRFAPSQGNCQPYKFAVIRDPELLTDMEEYCVGACKKLAAAVNYTTYDKGTFKYYKARVMARLFNAIDPSMLHPVPVTAITSIARGRFMVFHRAPTVILILMDKRGIGVPEVDIGIVGTNIVMAAESHRLGTCWIGFSKLLNRSKEWRDRLGIDDRFEVSEAIAVGYPVGKPWQNLIERPTHEIAWFEDGEKRMLG
jgi:nitroreductase